METDVAVEFFRCIFLGDSHQPSAIWSGYIREEAGGSTTDTSSNKTIQMDKQLDR